MKLPCEMIQDLLPLYHDGVCSEVSTQLVQAHLQDCQNCQNVLKSIKSEIEVPKMEQTAAKGLISIQKGWKKSMVLSCMKGFAAAALVFAILTGCFLGLTQWDWLPISTMDCQVAEIYQLSDGRILYRMDLPESAWCRSYKFEHHEDGSDYKIPVRPLISLGQLQGIPNALGDYHMIDPAENNAWQKVHGHGNPVTKWYWGHPDEAILIYEEGMVLELAPLELEEIYG